MWNIFHVCVVCSVFTSIFVQTVYTYIQYIHTVCILWYIHAYIILYYICMCKNTGFTQSSNIFYKYSPQTTSVPQFVSLNRPSGWMKKSPNFSLRIWLCLAKTYLKLWYFAYNTAQINVYPSYKPKWNPSELLFFDRTNCRSQNVVCDYDVEFWNVRQN